MGSYLETHIPSRFDFDTRPPVHDEGIGVPSYLFAGSVIVAAFISGVRCLASKFTAAESGPFKFGEVIASALIDNKGLSGALLRSMTRLRMFALELALAGIFCAQLAAIVLERVS